ncbi:MULTISPECIES: TRAP transporter substrate-binding protein [Pararhodobacter]|uniref:TRAP transporter substrate-binding protein DctP n=1 Tax=Pararhodobacter aggregans TaxID=404875 RepID=A0A2T7USM2_9RHOB|nr:MULTISPECIES: TRAP transporter substrate-binding protein [Pararhodobacter]PTX03283.1 tripartite ATP-independent transporter DctP family solute receptor [Pararhodobacter aggregans]PVE47588.1 TRAP transporter substrate-binding protein DctP [Pararhodobacter aggregans]
MTIETLTRQTRRSFLATGAAALAMPALATRGLAQQTYTCRIAHTEGIGTPITNAFDAWTEMLNTRSGGRIDAQHFPAAQLGGLAEALEGSRIGTIQVTTAGPDSEEAIAPEIAALGGAPGFIYKNEAHVDAVLQGELGRRASQIAREKTGVEFVAYGETGFRHILAKRPVQSLADLEGLKIRVPQLRIWVDFWSLLGAAPTPLPYSEQYSALSTGIIDAIDSDVFSIEGFRFYEQARYLTLTGHWFLPKAVRVNAAWLDSLPQDLQDLVRSSAQEAFAEQRRVNRALADQTLEGLRAQGVEIFALPEAELAQMEARTEPLFEQFGSVSPETAEMIAAIRALG